MIRRTFFYYRPFRCCFLLVKNCHRDAGFCDRMQGHRFCTNLKKILGDFLNPLVTSNLSARRVTSNLSARFPIVYFWPTLRSCAQQSVQFLWRWRRMACPIFVEDHQPATGNSPPSSSISTKLGFLCIGSTGISFPCTEPRRDFARSGCS
jgi:hypothetical protein